ncbi:MAG: hypothetical protein HY717_00965 [Planctomycetes bacterium]|nr:hypothetical protein [Planctomycetota bacterium]
MILLAAPFLAAAPIPCAPEDFSVELVAGEEQVVFPMFACFDDRGRLFVTGESLPAVSREEMRDQLAFLKN